MRYYVTERVDKELKDALKNKTVAELAAIMKSIGRTDIKVPDEKTDNPGLFRMRVGNVMRGVLRNEGRVDIMGVEVVAASPSAMAEA